MYKIKYELRIELKKRLNASDYYNGKLLKSILWLGKNKYGTQEDY